MKAKRKATIIKRMKRQHSRRQKHRAQQNVELEFDLKLEVIPWDEFFSDPELQERVYQNMKATGELQRLEEMFGDPE